jgi:hypothetical protein
MAHILSSSSGRHGTLGKLLHPPHDVGYVLGLLVIEQSGRTILDEVAEAARDASIGCPIRNRDDDLSGACIFKVWPFAN